MEFLADGGEDALIASPLPVPDMVSVTRCLDLRCRWADRRQS